MSTMGTTSGRKDMIANCRMSSKYRTKLPAVSLENSKLHFVAIRKHLRRSERRTWKPTNSTSKLEDSFTSVGLGSHVRCSFSDRLCSSTQNTLRHGPDYARLTTCWPTTASRTL